MGCVCARTCGVRAILLHALLGRQESAVRAWQRGARPTVPVRLLGAIHLVPPVPLHGACTAHAQGAQGAPPFPPTPACRCISAMLVSFTSVVRKTSTSCRGTQRGGVRVCGRALCVPPGAERRHASLLAAAQSPARQDWPARRLVHAPTPTAHLAGGRRVHAARLVQAHDLNCGRRRRGGRGSVCWAMGGCDGGCDGGVQPPP